MDVIDFLVYFLLMIFWLLGLSWMIRFLILFIKDIPRFFWFWLSSDTFLRCCFLLHMVALLSMSPSFYCVRWGFYPSVSRCSLRLCMFAVRPLVICSHNLKFRPLFVKRGSNLEYVNSDHSIEVKDHQLGIYSSEAFQNVRSIFNPLPVMWLAFQ